MAVKNIIREVKTVKVKNANMTVMPEHARRRVKELPKPIPKTPTPTTNGKKVIRDFSLCPRCGAGTEQSPTYSGELSQFWRQCVRCNTYINTYIPQEHQFLFHADPHRYKGNFGGYGSGKTTTSRQEAYKHMFITPYGTGLIGANISAQYEQTIKRDIEADFPSDLIKDTSVKNSYMELVNGYRLMYRPFDDPGKLRSLNLDLLIIVEGSEVNDQIFSIGKTRVRNTAATKQKTDDYGEPVWTYSQEGVPIPIIDGDWRTIIVESNPDAGWIKSQVLLPSSQIQINGDSVDKYVPDPTIADESLSSHITTTNANVYLPPTYYRDVSFNKPQWWINRYLLGSFTYAEGLVYPSALRNERTRKDHIIEPYEIPRHWKRMHALDYGLSDMTGMLWAAINEEENTVVIYKEEYVNNRNIVELSELIKRGSEDVPHGGWLHPYIIDPKSGVKRDYTKKSLIDHFLEQDISYVPGQISVDARVLKLNTMFELDRVQIFDTCTSLIGELKEYKFPSDDSSGTGRGDKPMDKNNHLINPLEWIVMELPLSPNEAVHGVYTNRGVDIIKQREQDAKEYGNFALHNDKQYVNIESTYDDINFNNTLGGIF